MQLTLLLALPLLSWATFTVRLPQGPSSSTIGCDNYATVSWDAAQMPPKTDHYDVLLLLSANTSSLVKELVKAFPQDDPPVGFAFFNPADGNKYAAKEKFVIAVVAKDGIGMELDRGYSPEFSLPVCESMGSSSTSFSDDTVDLGPDEEDDNEDYEESDHSNSDIGVSDSEPESEGSSDSFVLDTDVIHKKALSEESEANSEDNDSDAEEFSEDSNDTSDDDNKIDDSDDSNESDD